MDVLVLRKMHKCLQPLLAVLARQSPRYLACDRLKGMVVYAAPEVGAIRNVKDIRWLVIGRRTHDTVPIKDCFCHIKQ